MIKLVIWDLDDTLWRGTLADGDDVVLFEHRADLVRRLNQHGVVSSLCSKNDAATARAQVEAFGLWDEFVFPRIAFVPKGEVIAGIIAAMQLRAANVLFVDDNPHNLEEARHRLPDLQTLDIRDADADLRLEAIFSNQAPSRNRIAEYRSLERKQQDRQAATTGSDADFLRSCEIRAVAPPAMTNLDYLDRIAELINRSNQLNYTGSRVDRETLMQEVATSYCWSFFVQDKYGNHGLVGFALITAGSNALKHFAFSCRIMNMGVERYATHVMAQTCPHVVIPDAWRDRMGWGEANWIEDMPFNAAEAQDMIRVALGRVANAEPVMRIMNACQSAGMAHFSAHRDRIDVDVFPRCFALRSFYLSDGEQNDFPPFIVYGAGIDYGDRNWAGLPTAMFESSYELSLSRLCEHLTRKNVQALIFLPPEGLAPEHYPLEGHTPQRTMTLNALWREYAALYPCVTVLDMDEICAPDEMVDVNHAKPEALQTLSALIDVWYEHASAPAEAEEAA